MTWASGLGTIANALFRCAPACITGPMTAIISRPMAGPPEGRYAAGFVVGTLWIIAAIFAPFVVAGREILPAVLINLLTGLALFSVLCNAFVSAFEGPFRFGDLTCFLLTISEVTILNVGAPF
jgi:benzoate membrane transport protein